MDGPWCCRVTSVWWHGRKLRARLAPTAAFAHSNAPRRPGPRPLSCCQHTDRLSWIISYLPNLSLQRRAPFGGASNRAAMVHRLQAPLMDTLHSLPFCLAVFSNPCPTPFFPFITPSRSQMHDLSVIPFFVSPPFVYE